MPSLPAVNTSVSIGTSPQDNTTFQKPMEVQAPSLLIKRIFPPPTYPRRLTEKRNYQLHSMENSLISKGCRKRLTKGG